MRIEYNNAGLRQSRIIVMIGECTSPFTEVCKTEAVELKARPAERESSRSIEKTARRGPHFFFSHSTLQKPVMALSGGSQRRSWAICRPTLPRFLTAINHS